MHETHAPELSAQDVLIAAIKQADPETLRALLEKAGMSTTPPVVPVAVAVSADDLRHKAAMDMQAEFDAYEAARAKAAKQAQAAANAQQAALQPVPEPPKAETPPEAPEPVKTQGNAVSEPSTETTFVTIWGRVPNPRLMAVLLPDGSRASLFNTRNFQTGEKVEATLSMNGIYEEVKRRI